MLPFVDWTRRRFRPAILGLCWVFFLTLSSSCSFQDKIDNLSENFGTQRHGGSLPHSPYFISLVHKDPQNKWTTIWHAASPHVESPVIWGDTILFGGIIDKKEADYGLVHLLYYSEPTGVVDIAGAILRRAGAQGLPTLITLKIAGRKVGFKVYADATVEAELAIDEIDRMAQAVVAENKPIAVDGIRVWIAN